MRPSALVPLITALALVAAACSAGTNVGSGGVTTTPEPSEAPAAPVPTTPPALEAGGTSVGSVEIDGTEIEYVTSVPDGFTVGDEAPLLLAFPPGGQDLGLTQSLVEGTYAPEAQRLGWVVISPAAPAGVKYFDGSEALVPGFLNWVETWVAPEGGAPHVAGVSNGGISSFRYAAQNPDRVRSIISFPGFPRSSGDQEALPDLVGVPIRMYVGEADTSWIPPAEEAVASFTDAGGDIELTIFPGEGHVMASTRDGTVIFEQLEAFR